MLRQSSAARWALTLALTALVSFAVPARGWSSESVKSIAFDAARLAPPDLYRQLVRNHDAFTVGLTEPERGTRGSEEEKNPDGSGSLDREVKRQVDDAVEAIRGHRPFNEVAYRLGLVSYYLARANDPLAADRADPEERRFAADYDRYRRSTLPRLRRVFYGFHPGPADPAGRIESLVQAALVRGRGLYPLIGLEYRRVAFRSGVESFDDRSTAYAVAALSYNHAVSDLAETLRYIWVAAGGTDPRSNLPIRGRDAIRFALITSRADAFTAGR